MRSVRRRVDRTVRPHAAVAAESQPAPAVEDDLKNAGGKFVDAAAVVAGNVVTGRVPDDLPEFCRAIIDTIAGVATDGVYTLD